MKPEDIHHGPGAEATDHPVLDIHDLWKIYPGVVALAGAKLQLQRGEVHALVGENGAGKSTLIKILTGAISRDAGTISLDGKKVVFRSPSESQAGGIGTIYQEVNLIPRLSVAENLFLRNEPRRWGWIDRPRMNRQATEELAKLGVTIDVEKPLATHPLALQQMVALARAILLDCQLLVMDEPTSSLDPREVKVWFEVISQLKQQGRAVLFVSHRLSELYAICDRVTVLRDGKTVLTESTSRLRQKDLVAAMLGHERKPSPKRVEHVVDTETASGDQHDRVPNLLDALSLNRPPRLINASVSFKSGEVVGLAGLLGAGRTELARALFGADPPSSGTIKMDGQQVRFCRPAEAIRAKIGFCPEDRQASGIIPKLSVRENITLAALPHLSRWSIVRRYRQRQLVRQMIQRLDIKVASPNQAIDELSGGNQQKVLLARWLCTQPRLLILDEPTRGIDVVTKDEIRTIIDELAAQGLAVVMVSSELEDLIDHCHRILVMCEGCTVAEFSGDQIDEDSILTAIAHGAGSTAPAGE